MDNSARYQQSDIICRFVWYQDFNAVPPREYSDQTPKYICISILIHDCVFLFKVDHAPVRLF